MVEEAGADRRGKGEMRDDEKRMHGEARVGG